MIELCTSHSGSLIFNPDLINPSLVKSLNTKIVSYIQVFDYLHLRNQYPPHWVIQSSGFRERCTLQQNGNMSLDGTGGYVQAPLSRQVSLTHALTQSEHETKHCLGLNISWIKQTLLFRVSSGTSLSSLNESHTDLVSQMWKFGKNDGAVRMIRNMIANFPSCCVLDAEGKPVSWILTYASCAIGMLYTLPEHRGKGYAKILVSSLAERNHAQGYPVYCFIEEENTVSYRLFANLGFTEDPSHREVWFGFNDDQIFEWRTQYEC